MVLEKLLKKIGAVTGVDVLVKAASYLLLPIYLGMMPQEEFGQYSFIVAFISPIFLIASFSLYVPFIRNYCLSGDTEKKELISTIFCSLFLWLLMVDTIFILLKPFFLNTFSSVFGISDFPVEKYYLVIFLVNTGTLLLYCYSLLLARKKTTEIIVFMVCKFILITFCSLLSVYLKIFSSESVVNRMVGISIAEMVFVLILLLVYVRPHISLKIDYLVLKNNLAISAPLVPLSMVSFFIVMVDRTLIAEHHGLKVLASYGLAMVCLSPVQMIMTSIQTVWAPHLFSMASMADAFKKSKNIMWITSLAMMLGVFFLVLAMYAALEFRFISMDYEVVPTIIAMGSAGAIATSLMHLNSNMFVHLGKTTYALFIGLIVLSINWGLNVILIPHFSFYGAAIAAGLANITGLIIGLLVIKNLISKQIG